MCITAGEVCKTISFDWKWAHKQNNYLEWCALRSSIRAMRRLMIEHNTGLEEVDETDILITIVDLYIEETTPAFLETAA